jgi:hypothetical protein
MGAQLVSKNILMVFESFKSHIKLFTTGGLQDLDKIIHHGWWMNKFLF